MADEMDTVTLSIVDRALEAVRCLCDTDPDGLMAEPCAMRLVSDLLNLRDRGTEPMRRSVAMRLEEARRAWDVAYAARFGALDAPRRG